MAKESYAELLEKIKGKPQPTQLQIKVWTEYAIQIRDHLSEDLKGVELTDLDSVSELIQAYFDETQKETFGQEIEVYKGRPRPDTRKLASAILGVHPKAAVNLFICYDGMQVSVFVYDVRNSTLRATKQDE